MDARRVRYGFRGPKLGQGVLRPQQTLNGGAMYKTLSRKLQLGREIRSRKHVSSVPALAALTLKGRKRHDAAEAAVKIAKTPAPKPAKGQTRKVRSGRRIDPVRLYFYQRLKGRTSLVGSLGPDERPPDWLVAEIRRHGLGEWLVRMGRLKAASTRSGACRRPGTRREALHSRCEG